ITALAFSPDGKVLAAVGADRRIRLWEVLTGTLCESLKAAGSREIDAMAFAPDGRVLACLNRDGACHLWDLVAGKDLDHFAPARGPVSCLGFSPDGGHLLLGTEEGAAPVWERGRPAETGGARTEKATDRDLEQRWADLHRGSAAAYRAIRALAAS